MRHFECLEVEVHGVSHEDRIWRQHFLNGSLHVGQSHVHVCEHFLGQTGVFSQVILQFNNQHYDSTKESVFYRNSVLRLHERVKHDAAVFTDLNLVTRNKLGQKLNTSIQRNEIICTTYRLSNPIISIQKAG